MKVETAKLKNFLNKTIMSGTEGIEEGILKFGKDGLKLEANSITKFARTMGWFKKDNFKEYEELGNVCMNDLGNIINVLARFGKEITLKKEGNLLTIKGDGKTVDIELVAESFLKTDADEPKLEFAETFNLKAGKLSELFKDVQMNKDAIIKIETKEKIVEFSNTGKYKFINTIEAPTCKGGEKVSFGEPFIDATTKLDGDLTISIKKEYPAKIMETTEESVITIIVAPRVEGDDE